MASKRRSRKKKPKLPRIPRRDAGRGLPTEQQERFIDGVGHGLTGTQAAIAAGYAPGRAKVTASELRKNPRVAAAIKRAFADVDEDYRPSYESLLRRILLKAMVDPSEIIKINANSLSITNTDELSPGARLMILEATESTNEHGGSLHIRIDDPHKYTLLACRLLKYLDPEFTLRPVDPSKPAFAARLYLPVQLEA